MPITPIILIHVAIAVGTATLLGPALFWDDWIVVGAPADLNIELFTQAGTAFGWTGRVHSALSEENLVVYRLGIVSIWALICAMFGWIAHLPTKDWKVGALIATLTMIAPFNSAKFAIINTPAVLCVAAFMTGWIVMRRSTILASTAFLISFTLPSLLFLYALAFAEHVWRIIKSNDLFSARSLISTAWLAALPPLYWLFKSVWLHPYGIYENYNQSISLRNAISAIRITLTDIKYIIQHLEVGWYAATAAFAIALIPISKRIIDWAFSDHKINPDFTRRLAISGAAALLLAATPYLIAGHAPRWAVWDSRNQVLIPFAFAILAVSGLTAAPRGISTVFLATTISISLVYWCGQGYLLWRDWQKQEFIQKHWESNLDVADADIIILDDKSSSGFANRRSPKFYELSGMLADAYKDERRIGIEASQWIDDICDPGLNVIPRSRHYRTGDAASSAVDRQGGLKVVRSTLSDDQSRGISFKALTNPTSKLTITTKQTPEECDNQVDPVSR